MNVKPKIQNKFIGLRISEELYRKFEKAVGKGNVSMTLRKFIKTKVKEYEKEVNK